jgi:flavin reductase (DIM6/NTAB) family NADH-FMN oxidoreductase RutF
MAKGELGLSLALRLIAPGPVTLITTEDRGIPNLAAGAWVMPVCERPPVVAVSLSADRLTRRNLEERGEFVLSIPPRSLLRETHFCGTVSGRVARKERETGLRLEGAGKVRAPLVAAAIGHLECRVVETRPVGDHVVFFAEVVLAIVDESLFDGAWNTDDVRARTLHHLGGDLYASTGRRVTADPRRPVEW